MLLKVAAEGKRWLVDAGFGGEGPGYPLPLEEGEWTDWTGVTHRLSTEGPIWVLSSQKPDGSWSDLYAFDERVHLPADYLMYNHFTSTFPSSLFVQSMLVSLHTADGQVLLFDGSLRRRVGRTTTERQLDSRAEVLRALREDFGIAPPELVVCPL